MSDHNAKQDTATLPAFIPERPTTFQQHQKRIAQLVSEEMHDGKAWKPEAYSRYNEIENQETVTTPLSQSAERMTAEQFAEQFTPRLCKPRTFGARYEEMEAYAEHCTAALTRELEDVKAERDQKFFVTPDGTGSTDPSDMTWIEVLSEHGIQIESFWPLEMINGEALRAKHADESSAVALVRELAKLNRYVTHDPKCPEFSQKANRFNEGQVQDSAFPCECGLESLLSDPAVKKVLEK